jgi:hypothetical protein
MIFASAHVGLSLRAVALTNMLLVVASFALAGAILKEHSLLLETGRFQRVRSPRAALAAVA